MKKKTYDRNFRAYSLSELSTWNFLWILPTSLGSETIKSFVFLENNLWYWNKIFCGISTTRHMYTVLWIFVISNLVRSKSMVLRLERKIFTSILNFNGSFTLVDVVAIFVYIQLLVNISIWILSTLIKGGYPLNRCWILLDSVTYNNSLNSSFIMNARCVLVGFWLLK